MVKHFLCISSFMASSVLGLMVFASPVKAQAVDCAVSSDGNVAASFCVDEFGNSAVAIADSDGNKVVVDSNGNYEYELRY
ncbi:hypothetical protein FEV09_18430 [Pseudanabaena catenata USMAC16]|uniref:Uncharacterized protein n=3 Tax=Pseudanabaena TaxID=1152 RepID=L8MZ23_9CYAN|nr:hypothetical protein [Pseudanabaena catenata]ELS31223.1 hypothetical protein Pse7429DRAFT_3602 [Pseudanabaena biceps PCC 7429]MDG3496521.1 hypothetical protein [Pseudanabaena catenata USMAC16]